MKTVHRDVSCVTAKEMCCGCGACYVACKYNAIVLEKNPEIGVYAPIVDRIKCIDCGKCFEVCYGREREFPREVVNEVLGKYCNIYCGYSLDEKLRYDAASGGCVSELLRYALKKKMIAGAIVTQMNLTNGLNSKVIIARSEEEIVRSKGSKYFPTASCSVLKEILNDGKKYIFVGLPCHIYGLRKLQYLYPQLKERILLAIGLFCGHLVNFSGTECFVASKGISPESVVGLSYRGHGWPGKSSILSNDSGGNYVLFESQEVWSGYFRSNIFTPKRCMLCDDLFAVDADISVGDAWDRDLLCQKTSGYSLMIARNEEAVKILQRASNDNQIKIETYESEKVKSIFSQNLFYKKKMTAYLKRVKKLSIVRDGIVFLFLSIPIIIYWGMYSIMKRSAKLMRCTLFRKLYNKVHEKYMWLLRVLYEE